MPLREDYPWTKEPLICVAPMRLITLAPLAVAVSQAGGLGFIGAGNDTTTLEDHFQEAERLLKAGPNSSILQGNTLPVGVGFLNWGADMSQAEDLVRRYKPCAIWFFAARSDTQMQEWTERMRTACPETKIWIQVGTAAQALQYSKVCSPDVLVVQGADAGGHGLSNGGASLLPLLLEVQDSIKAAGLDRTPTIVATGGIADGRGVAAALALGAEGVVLGTRFLATPEANIAQGYQQAVLSTNDGGTSTIRTSVYDTLRGTTDWPPGYGGRGVINRSYHDSEAGMSMEENKTMYEEALKKGDAGWGTEGRLTTYAGTNVGLVNTVKPAAEIVSEILEETQSVLQRLARR